ncbi:Flp family type IVb pilin [Arthrobacter sp. OAP107]|uniref:Flp family type IVb pilin n=1 Tax=Arthrobacter sp. OAP107 TaxID=3156445 RepID=UPI00339A91E6
MVSLIASLHVLGLNLKQRLTREETGATAVEYALMVGLIAVVLIGGLTVFGPQLSTFFSGLGGQLGIVPKVAG